ncbi:MAG: hypothetical protein GY861_15910, partial [bacterium]|nr:hypothetical protein [bacterium]
MASNININSESASNIETPSSGRKRLFLNSDNSDHLTSKDENGLFHDYDDTTQRTFNIKKSTSGTLNIGELVYLVDQDETNNVVTAELAKADSESTMDALCVMIGDATDLVAARAISAGTIGGLDTSGFNAGDELYVSSSNAGEFVNVAPTGTNITQHVGTAGNIDASDGTIIVSVSGSEHASSDLAERVQTTGLLEGGIVSQDTSTTVDWTSGRGQIADYSDPENPVISDVTWNAVSGQSITNIATDGVTAFGYDSDGNIVEKLSTAMTIADAHDAIWFASVFHLSGAIVGVITIPGNLGYDGVGSYTDFINLVIGPANISGNVYSANGTNLNIDVVGGPAYLLGANFRNNPQISDSVILGSDTALSFYKVYKSAGAGASMEYDGTPVTAIDPTQYDDGSGTLASVTSGYWTIQRIFRGRDGMTIVAYGQQEFATKTLATEALGKESFTEKSPLPFMLYRCSLVVDEGATDLSDTAEAEFFAQSSFRITGATSSGATIPGITSPGGAEGSIQFNTSNTFNGVSQLLAATGATDTDLTIKPVTTSGHGTLDFTNVAGASRGSIEYGENINKFGIFVAPDTAAFEIENLAPDVDTQVFLTDDATFAISATGANTNPPLSTESFGTNGAKINWYNSIVVPEGVITANPGDVCIYKNGTSSKTYQHKSASAGNTGWKPSVTGSSSSINNSIAIFDSTSGGSIDDFPYALLSVTGTTTRLELIAGASGISSVSFCDSGGTEQGSIGWHDDTVDTFFVSSDNSKFMFLNGHGTYVFTSGSSTETDVRIKATDLTSNSSLTLSDDLDADHLVILYNNTTGKSSITDSSGDLTITSTGKVNFGSPINLTDTDDGFQIDDTVVFYSNED